MPFSLCPFFLSYLVLGGCKRRSKVEEKGERKENPQNNKKMGYIHILVLFFFFYSRDGVDHGVSNQAFLLICPQDIMTARHISRATSMWYISPVTINWGPHGRHALYPLIKSQCLLSCSFSLPPSFRSNLHFPLPHLSSLVRSVLWYDFENPLFSSPPQYLPQLNYNT